MSYFQLWYILMSIYIPDYSEKLKELVLINRLLYQHQQCTGTLGRFILGYILIYFHYVIAVANRNEYSAKELQNVKLCTNTVSALYMVRTKNAFIFSRLDY